MTIEETFNLLITKVQDNITTNGQGDITGKKNRDTLIEILQGIQSVLDAPDDYLLGQFPPYDPDFTYQGGKEVVVTYNGKLWAFVSESDKQGVQPGTTVAIWFPVSALSLAHYRNQDQFLAFGDPNQVSAAEIRQFIDNFEEGDLDVLGKVLTGFVVGPNEPVADTDSVLSAFQKLQGQIDGFEPGGDSKFKGVYLTIEALELAHPTAEAGAYADVDAGVGVDTVRYVFDLSDVKWVASGSGTPMTAAQVKSLYESNANTNAYTDGDKTKVGKAILKDGSVDFTAPQTGVPGTDPNHLATVSQLGADGGGIADTASDIPQSRVAGEWVDALTAGSYIEVDGSEVSVNPEGLAGEWVQVSEALPVTLIDVKCGGTTWIAVSDNGSTNAAVVRSDDDGLTWTVQAHATNMSAVGTSRQGVWIIGALYRKLFRSDDDGLTWTEVYNRTNTAFRFYAIEAHNEVFIVATMGYILRSVDDGLTWTEVHSSGGANASYLGNDIWIVGEYRSDDNGLTWSGSSLDMPESYEMMSESNHNGIAVVVQDYTIARTDDYGVTWAYQTMDASHNYGRIAQSNNIWRIVSSMGGSTHKLSVDNGITWVDEVLLFPNGSIAVSETSVWIAARSTIERYAAIPHLITSDGRFKFTSPQKGVEGVEPDDLATVSQLGASPEFKGFMYSNGTNQAIPTATYTKVTSLTSQDFDTNDWYDPATGRFQPDIAGIYLVGGITTYSNATNNCIIITAVYKNGTLFRLLGRGTVATASNGYAGFGGAVPIVMNGTSDYLELYTRHDAAGTINLAPTTFPGYTYFYGYKID